MNDTPLIQLHDLGFSYAGEQTLHGIDLTVNESEFVAVIGPSGCGKSTLLRLVSGLLMPSTGEVLVGWNKRDARIRISEHAEATYGATLCGRCMAFCTAGHDAMNRRMRPDQTAYQNDEVLHKDGTIRVADRVAALRKRAAQTEQE